MGSCCAKRSADLVSSGKDGKGISLSGNITNNEIPKIIEFINKYFTQSIYSFYFNFINNYKNL